MNNNTSQGKKLREAISEHTPLQIVGTINAFSALLAEKQGHKAIYLSGGGVAASSMGVPDLGITTLQDVLTDVRRITDVCDLPLLVDADTGWGGAFNIARMIKSMISSGAAGIHIEDQVDQKRCGHRPNKELVSSEEMQDRIKAATDSRDDESFLIMARTDSIANEGIDLALERAISYTEAGADAVFVEAVSDLQQYKIFSDSLEAPILANITEFGLTPLFSVEDLKKVGVDIVLYPLSAFRSMSKAAEEVYKEIIEKGTQEGLIDKMQTREELYKVINYHDFEKKIDELFKK